MWCNLWKKKINIAITFHDILVRNCNISDYCVVHLQSSLNIYVQYNQMIIQFDILDAQENSA